MIDLLAIIKELMAVQQ